MFITNQHERQNPGDRHKQKEEMKLHLSTPTQGESPFHVALSLSSFFFLGNTVRAEVEWGETNRSLCPCPVPRPALVYSPTLPRQDDPAVLSHPRPLKRDGGDLQAWASCWGAPGRLSGQRGAGRVAGRSGGREGAEEGGVELSLPIRRRIVPDTRRPRGVSVSGSFAGAVTHARGVGLRAGSGQE
jgi:hypothetical protein